MKQKILLILFITLTFSVLAQVPTRWRGPEGNGIYPETGLLKVWPASGPQILWSYDKLGDGFSSPVFANNKIYLSGSENETGYIYALSNTGQLLWKVPYGPEFTESYPGARSTPVVVDDLLYQYSGMAVIYCLDANNGSLKWKKELIKEMGAVNLQWGVTETPVIEGDKLFLTPGGKVYNVVALNRMNGKLIWASAAKGEKSAYCTPVLVKLPARTLLVTHTESNIVGHDANTGKFLWSVAQPNQWSVHSNTPLYQDGALFCFSGYGQGGPKLKLSADGSSVTKEWFSKSFDNRIGGAVLVNGYIYGSGDNTRAWQCIDWKTGEQKYAFTGLANGTVIYADGMLYCYSDRGQLALVEATPAGFNIKSQTKVELGSAQHWAHPVIDQGRLFIRHGKSLIAYKIK